MKAIDRLTKGENAVLDFLQRFAFVRAFEKALTTTTRDKPFIIRNDDLWAAMLAAQDAFFIHFASWSRSAYQRSGLFAQLSAHHLSELYIKRPRGRSANAGLAGELRRARRAAMEASFPDAAARGKVLAEDVEALKDQFEAIIRPVVEDRDGFRAHPYERNGAGTAAMLGIENVLPIFEQVQEIMNNLRLITDDSMLGYHGDLAATNPDSTARDMTDLILFGSMDRVSQAVRCIEKASDETAYPALVRETLYEHLHAAHDASEGDLMFNDRRLIDAVCGHSDANG